MAAVWAGLCRVGAFTAGDGTASAAAELVGEHATITLAVVIDPDTRILRLADVAPLDPPPRAVADLNPDVTWITRNTGVPEIDSDTRPFRIDRPGSRKRLITTTQVEASTFPGRCTSFK